MENPIFRKRQNKYFPELIDEDENMHNSQSILLKTIRIPKNIMHLSSRLPKKNYESTLIAGYNSDDRKGGTNFKSNYLHNSISKK